MNIEQLDPWNLFKRALKNFWGYEKHEIREYEQKIADEKQAKLDEIQQYKRNQDPQDIYDQRSPLERAKEKMEVGILLSN